MKAKFSQSCLECHFLTKELYVEKVNKPYRSNLKVVEREKIRKHDFLWVREAESLCCHFGVWDEGVKRLKDEERYKEIVETNREKYCFFWKYRPGMLFKAAEVLQRRDEERREASRDRKLTIWGLWIAATGLFISAILQIINFVKN